MTRHSAQRGQILIYAMLTMSAMLAIGLTLSGLFVAKLRSVGAARNSTVAIYTSDSAVEKCLYEARNDTAMPPLVFSPVLAGATYTIVGTAAGNQVYTDACNGLGSGTFGFRATGTYRGVSRTLEITQ